MARGRKKDALGLRCFLGRTDIYLEAKFGKGFEDQPRADLKVVP